MSITPLPVAPSQTDSVTDFDQHAFDFVASLQLFRTEANSTADEVQTNADITAALALGMALPNYGGTSVTSLLIGTGAKSFVTQAGKSWVAGQIVVASNGGNYMKGTVTSYTSTTLVLDVTRVVGSGTFASWTIGLSYESLGLSPRATRIDVASVAGLVNLTLNAPDTDDIRITGALAITGFTVAVGRVLRVTAGGAFTLTNGAGLVTQTGANIVCASGDTFMLRATAANVVEVLAYTSTAPSVQVTTCQTVLSGPVDTNGFPTFLPATSVNLNLTSQNISTGVNALVATSSGGANGTGAIDSVGQAVANLTWTGCTANQTNYLPVSIAAGVLTALTPVILAPIYQEGGTPAVTAGQYTYNIAQRIMYLGNGSTAPAVRHVIVGEAVAGASTITSTVEYAYQGRCVGSYGNAASLTATAFTHNLGVKPGRHRTVLLCVTAEFGAVAGDEVDDFSVNAAGLGETNGMSVFCNKYAVKVQTGYRFAINPYGTSQVVNAYPTAANWKLKSYIDRGW